MRSPKDRPEACETVARLSFLRSRGVDSEDQLARDLGYVDTDGTPLREAMYEGLTAWGLPGWLVYPEGEREAAEKEKKGRKRKKGETRTLVGRTKLPPPEGAADLLRDQIRRPKGTQRPSNYWENTLEEDLDELRQLKEWMSGEYFVWTLDQGHDPEVFLRDDIPEEAWRSLCAQRGLDPETTQAIEGPEEEPVPHGARWWPWQGWLPLIAVYALKNPSIRPLIEALHPNPSSVDLEASLDWDEEGDVPDNVVTDFRVAAWNLARVVRGGEVRKGRRYPVSYQEAWMKERVIDPLARRGRSDEEISEELRAWGFPGRDSSPEAVRRIRGLDLSPPE